MYYVYMLIRPDTNLPFYVGKGKDDRVFSHLREVKNNKSTNLYKTRLIEKYIKQGYTYDDLVCYHTIGISEDQAYNIEEALIRNYQNILTNVHLGGSGGPIPEGKTYEDVYGVEKANEIKNKISKANSGKPAHNKGATYVRSRKAIANYKLTAKKRVESNPELKKEMVNRCIDNAKSRKGKSISEDEKLKKKSSFFKNNKKLYESIIALEDHGITSISAITRTIGCGRGKIETFFRNREFIVKLLGL